MKLKKIAMYTLAGLATLPVVASAAQGDLLQKMDLMTPGSDAPAYKVKANEKTGTQWKMDMAYGYFNVHRGAMGEQDNINLALIHGNLNQRLIQDDVNGGTWLHVEVIGSWGLDPESVHSSFLPAVTANHRDVVGPSDLYFPEVAIKHFFLGKRAAIIGGMVKFGDYFDAVSIANDTFTSFINSGFCNSTVLPLIDSNLGAIAQVELSAKNYVMAGVTRTGTQPGHNPFQNDGDGYIVMAEWGHHFSGDKGVLRITPFYRQYQLDVMDPNDLSVTGSEVRRNAGVVGSVEYKTCDSCTVYVRAGYGAKQCLGNAVELSVGTHLKLVPSREKDFLGISYGVFKGLNGDEMLDENGDSMGAFHNREHVVEVMYNLQLSKYFAIAPHFQYVHNPAYTVNRDATVAGCQAVFSF